MAVDVLLAVALFFVFFMFFLVTGEHCNNVGKRRMSECSQIEMDDDKCAEEYEEEHMDHISNLYPADEIYSRSEEFWIPQEKARDDLDRDQGCHNHEIRYLLHRVKLMVKC